VQELCDELSVPRSLSALGVCRAHLPALVHSSRGNSMSGNPRALEDAELRDILESLL
jgi:alcohol dehydrogenase class IV